MNKNKKLTAIQPYIWLLPSVVLMVTMIVIPIISVFKISFSEALFPKKYFKNHRKVLI